MQQYTVLYMYVVVVVKRKEKKRAQETVFAVLNNV
jgi:hypothetical protein